MGQNQDKTESGEQVPHEQLEETKLCHNSLGLDTHSGEIKEGERLCDEEEEDEKQSDDPQCYHLNESPSYEPTITSIERDNRLCESQYPAREVRQGGAAEKEGGGEHGGGGWTVPLSPHETEKNPESTLGTDRLKTTQRTSKVNKNKRKTVEQLQASTKTRMEHQAEEISPPKDVNSEEACTLENSKQDSVMLKTCTHGTHTGCESLFVQDLNEIIVDETGNEDTKLCMGTGSFLTERKEPPPAQPLHPLENSLQKESLLHMCDTIEEVTPKEKTEINEKEVSLKYALEYTSPGPKWTDVCEQETQPSHPDMAETNKASESGPNGVLDTEPSSILEKLLKRNKTEATPSLAKIKEVYTNTTEGRDADKVLNNTSAAALSDQNYQPVLDTKSSLSKQPETNSASKDSHIEMRNEIVQNTSYLVCLQPEASGNSTCESSQTESHYLRVKKNNSTEESVKADGEIGSNIGPSEEMSAFGSQQSAVSHKTASCELPDAIVEESKPSLTESTPKDSSGQITNSSQSLNEETDSNIVGHPSSVKSEINNKTSGSGGADSPSVGRAEEKEDPKETVSPPVHPDAPLGAVGLVFIQESSRVSSCTQPDPQSPNSENAHAEGPNVEPYSEKDIVSMRDKSQSSPKPRPVSDLIKETIQLHEKLQHHDRPKPAEIKPAEEQAQSVKVAQMKAAFDSAQRSPDKAVERKPSVRRGKGFHARTAASLSFFRTLLKTNLFKEHLFLTLTHTSVPLYYSFCTSPSLFAVPTDSE
ncbi:uncharacterized protein si:ch211-108c6.2 [Cyprinodon tularosa]|uniref:uncharacterized protein si:ch211-108c6.2 n=1 Tax=Cyprinodon tularosa TaxID=77115 RepID=UPI0018E2748A|nr:uncharacterized protein si:ch211-108c6.2 [Cyprinodon tularosa]